MDGQAVSESARATYWGLDGASEHHQGRWFGYAWSGRYARMSSRRLNPLALGWFAAGPSSAIRGDAAIIAIGVSG